MSDWDTTKRDFLILVAMFTLVYSILIIGVFMERLEIMAIASIIAIVDLVWIIKRS